VKIAVIGTGNVGSVLGTRWAKSGHEVIWGTRDPNSDKIHALLKQIGPNARAASAKEAADAAEVVVLATPWTGTQAVVQSLGDLRGKVLIDCTNPLAPGMKWDIGHTTSGGEQVAA
jgi:predicted dinucleotide-binding enzyme